MAVPLRMGGKGRAKKKKITFFLKFFPTSIKLEGGGAKSLIKQLKKNCGFPYASIK